MKPFSFFFLVVIFLVPLGGCTLTKDFLVVDYTPQSSPRSLPGADQTRIQVEVKDYRSIKDRVSAKKNGFGAETAPIIATNSIADVFADAIRTELQNRGFQIGDGSVAVAVELSRFYNDFKPGMMSGNAVAEAALNVTVRVANGRPIFSKALAAEGSHSGFTTLNGANAKIALDNSLQNVVAKLVDDPEFLNSLTHASAAPSTTAPAVAVAPPRAPLSDVDELPAIRPATMENAHAIVIGVERYREKLPPADFAASDARLMARYLTKVLGYPEQNVAVLINEQANKSDFEKYFERWLPNRIEKTATVFVYYSGHGAPDPVSGDTFLVPHDGDPTYLTETAYPLKRLFAGLAKLPTQKITVVMDSCFSGAGGRSVIAQGAKPLVMVSSSAPVSAGITVLTASAGNQISHSYEEKGHGLFTYFLLKGIKEQSGAGPLSFKKIFDYAAPQVSTVARRQYNNDQVPQWQGTER